MKLEQLEEMIKELKLENILEVCRKKDFSTKYKKLSKPTLIEKQAVLEINNEDPILYIPSENVELLKLILEPNMQEDFDLKKYIFSGHIESKNATAIKKTKMRYTQRSRNLYYVGRAYLTQDKVEIFGMVMSAIMGIPSIHEHYINNKN